MRPDHDENDGQRDGVSMEEEKDLDWIMHSQRDSQ